MSGKPNPPGDQTDKKRCYDKDFGFFIHQIFLRIIALQVELATSLNLWHFFPSVQALPPYFKFKKSLCVVHFPSTESAELVAAIQEVPNVSAARVNLSKLVVVAS